jgi:ketosteroid isomerase-like protein
VKPVLGSNIPTRQLLAAAVLICCSLNDARAQPTQRDRDVRALLALENEWAAAAVRRDGAAFRRLIAPGFVYSEDDRTMTRAELIDGLVSGSDTVQHAHNEEMGVHHFGSVAVVTGWLIMRGRGASGPFDRRYRYTDTWMKRDGRWQVIAAHDYLMPEGRR